MQFQTAMEDVRNREPLADEELCIVSVDVPTKIMNDQYKPFGDGLNFIQVQSVLFILASYIYS